MLGCPCLNTGDYQLISNGLLMVWNLHLMTMAVRLKGMYVAYLGLYNLLHLMVVLQMHLVSYFKYDNLTTGCHVNLRTQVYS